MKKTISVSMIPLLLSTQTVLGSTEELIKKLKLPTFGFAYNYKIKNNDDGRNKSTSSDQATTTNRLETLRVALKGKASEKVSYAIEFNGAKNYGTPHDPLDHAEIKYMHDNFAMILGNPLALLYGWRGKLQNPLEHSAGAMLSQSPWGRNDGIQLSYTTEAIGNLNAQFIRDTTSNSAKENSVATSIEWWKKFGNLYPLLQFTSYDKNHSKTYSVGLRFMNDIFDLRLDYVGDKKYSSTRNGQDEITGFNIEGYYTLGEVEFFGMYSSFENKQFGTDVKVNTAGNFDDNQTTIAAGIGYNGLGTAFKPYFTYEIDSGDFTNSTTNSTESFDEVSMTLGIKGYW